MNSYEILGINENADEKQIRNAYLLAVKKYHPDRYKDNPLKDLAEEKLKQINMAYDEILVTAIENAIPQYKKEYSTTSRRKYEERAYTTYSNSGDGCCDCCCEIFCCGCC